MSEPASPAGLWQQTLDQVAAAYDKGICGQALCDICNAGADALVTQKFAAAARDSVPAAVIAVGAYGRNELCPYSDLDLWFVIPASAKRSEVDAFVHDVVYPLWDEKVALGHAVRTVPELIELAQTDLTTFTALLDIRLVAGSSELFQELQVEARRLFAREVEKFLRLLERELTERRARFGDTMFLLEPNIKNGEGGYRDLLVGLWAAKARFGVDDFADLMPLGEANIRQVSALKAARDFFLTLRCSLQLLARRKNDRLTFEAQEQIAPRVCPEPLATNWRGPDGEMIRPAVTPAVEALMQRYFVCCKSVKRETRRIMERSLQKPQKRPTIHPLDGSFSLFNGRLSTRDPDLFATRPSEMVRIFNVAIETGAELYGHTRDLIADFASRTDLSADTHAGREFMKLLTDVRDRRVPSMLEEAHDLGVLNSLLPEFAPCTGRVQHDLYHVYTVDQHSLYAVQRLKAIERGELNEALPLATQAMSEVARRPPLYLGTLLHDVGKPLGKGHSETGAKLAVTIATRLGLIDDDVHQTEFLVRKHLLLSHLSQRRDLNDVAMVANLAEELSDEETLRELYLLTLSDMSMVSPGNLTDWKEQLLRELYSKTLAHFRRGPDLLGSDRSELVVKRRARTAELMGIEPEEITSWFSSLPDRYVAVTQPKEIMRHILLSRRRNALVAHEVVQRARQSLTELVICTLDRPGLLSMITGVLWAHRINVLSAEIHSRRVDVGKEVLDVFTVRDRYDKAVTDEKRWQKVQQDLERVLGGALTMPALLRERHDKASLPPRVTPPVKTEISVDNDVSSDFSVLDVYTQDRPGVLYAITQTLAESALDIHLSKVSTEGVRVADVFYVQTAAGEKLNAGEVSTLVAKLYAMLAEVPHAA